MLRHALRAFPTLLRVGLAEVVAYRAEFLVWILTTNMPLVMLGLWSAVAADHPVGPFGQKEFVAYYLGMLAVRLLTSSWVVWQLIMEVREGALAPRLMRPLHPLLAYAAEHLAAVPVRVLIASPLLVVVAFAAGDKMAFSDPTRLALLVPSLVGAWLLIFFTMVSIGALALFIDSALGLFELWLGIHAILSGYLVPLQLMPEWVTQFAGVLPFRYMLGFPVELLVGLESPAAALGDLGLQWAYVAVMGAVTALVWRAGTRRFVAYGG